ncbi:MAG TPA: hypothetical protein DHW82_04925 [Spirochaetia bacterium]|nr:MAG: hypothetical protein A2Y41_13240 [Spirochaetes bacterium GWB1_36_13]HCL56335.1 hypothetical protein [Spirochaetia bacterium]
MNGYLNETDLSFPINIWNKFLYYDTNEIKIDVFYNSNGYPKYIHNEFGAEDVNKFRINLIEEIKKKNNTKDIWRLSSDAFAIIHDLNNCEDFDFEYKGIKQKILKKMILIKTFIGSK